MEKTLIVLALVLTTVCNLSCKQDQSEQEIHPKEMELTSDPFMNKLFNEKLTSLNEPNISEANETVFRLTVISSLTNTHVIRITKGPIGRVDYTMEGDNNGSERIGINSLSTSYTSKSKLFDSMVTQLTSLLHQDDFLNYKETKIPNGADGTLYLFEYKHEQTYRSVLRWDVGFYKTYKDTDNFIQLCNAMSSFVPACLHPLQEDKIKHKKDLLFPVFKNDSTR